MTFQEERLKVLKWYRFIRVQGRHNCSPAASFANCVMTLYLLKGICKLFFLQQLLKNAKFSVATFLSQLSDILFASSATFITFVLYTGIDKIINKLCRSGGGRQILANCFFFLNWDTPAKLPIGEWHIPKIMDVVYGEVNSVKNTTINMAKWWWLLAKNKLHVSAYSGHLQVLTIFY